MDKQTAIKKVEDGFDELLGTVQGPRRARDDDACSTATGA